MLEYFGKVDVRIPTTYKKTQSVTVLATRSGARAIEGVSPEKYADEIITKPIETVSFSEKIVQKAQEVARNTLYTPELVLNLKKMKYESGILTLETNTTNYGSVIAARKIIPPEFTEEESLRVINNVAPIGITSIILSEKNQWAIMGKRGNVLVGSRWHGFPNAIVNEESDLLRTLIEEAYEEVAIKDLFEITTPYLVGVARGRYHATNPNFNYLIYTDLSFKDIWEGSKRGVVKGTSIKEHDLIVAVPISLDEDPFSDWIKDNLKGYSFKEDKIYDKIVDVGLGCMLQAGRTHFGNKWYNRFTKELMDPPFNTRISESNPFA